jgi:hypothetical protein
LNHPKEMPESCRNDGHTSVGRAQAKYGNPGHNIDIGPPQSKGFEEASDTPHEQSPPRIRQFDRCDSTPANVEAVLVRDCVAVAMF